MRFDDQAMGGEIPQTDGNEASQARIQLAMNLHQPPAGMPVSANAVRIMPGPDGIVTLPPGTGLDDVRVQGRDLVVTLPDGTQWIIVDGAVFVPQLVIGNVQVPPANLAALLIGQEPQPAAGPPQSSGGNFAIPVGGIGDPFDLGDLLPPTDLSFGTPQREEVYYPFPNDEPDVIVITPDDPTGAEFATASVSEAGLPARGNEPPGSNAAANSETTTGSIVITSGDPPFTVTINGVAVTAVGQTFVTPIGTLTITSIANNAIGYSYTLRDNTSGDNTSDVFAIVVTDRDGDTAPGSLTINVVDDVPTARADTDSVASGASSTTGNVITGIGTDSGSAGADTQGADGAALSGARSGTTGNFTAVGAGGATIVGQFGTLVIAADGSYTYTKNANVPGGSADVFTYQLTDGDGDTSTATLTITNPDNPVSLTVPEAGAPGTIVFEAGLPDGSNANASSEIASGTIAFSAPDGPATVTINGVAVTGVGQVIQVSGGTLTVTSVTANAIGYTYTLSDNFLTDPVSVSIPVTVTDSDGDSASATLVINVVDDVPTARNDAASPAEDTAVTIDVFANDTSGADGVNLATGVALGTAPAKGTAVYNGDGTFTYTPTPGQEGTDSFTYTITDGDGDTSTATVTITLAADSTPTIDVGAANSVAEAGLSFGSDPAANSEFATGSFAIATGNDTVGSVVINGTNVTNGGTVAGAFGTLTVTVTAGVYSYSYELTANTSGDAAAEIFNVVVTDSDGDVAGDTLVIDIVDDVPTARNDANSVGAGSYGPVTGDVLANDTQGADGAAVSGVSSVNNGASDTSADGSGNFEVVGQYGTLTLNADGSYSYARAAGTPGGVTETFTYTLTDGDGDTSTAQLVITINDATPVVGANATVLLDDDALSGGNPGGTDDDPDAANLTGTLSGSGGDGPLTFTATGVSLSPGLIGGGFNQAGPGVFQILQFGNPVLTVTIDSATGAYTVTQNAPFFHQIGGDENNQTVTFSYRVTDADGDFVTGSLVINVDDDTPVITVEPGAAPTLTVDESDLSTDASANFSVAFNPSFGADGPNIADATVYTLGLNAGSTGIVDTATGEAVVLVLNGNVVEGRTSGTDALVFTVSVAADGTVTLNQLRAVRHDDINDPNDSVTLAADDLVTLTQTITDRDGDSASATINIGSNLTFLDDGPSATDEPAQSLAEGATVTGTFDFAAGADGGTVTAINGIALVFGADGFSQEIDVGDGLIKVKADGSYSFTADASVAGTGSASGTFTVTDGDGDTATADFSFTVTDANAPTGGTTSAAVDDDGLAGGNPASTAGDLDANAGDDPADTSEASFTGLLALDFGGDGPGTVGFAAMDGLTAAIGQETVTFSWNAGTNTLTATGPRGALFTVQVTDPTTGTFKVTLLDNVLHAPGGGENDASAALTYTVTDSDGSTATGTLNITFDDDAPTVTANGTPLPTLTVDETSLGIDATASFASVFTPVFGADGPAAANAVTYALGVNAGATGLVDTATGQTVVLVLNGAVVEGRTSGSNALVFTVTVDAAGNVTLDQLRAVVHSPDTGPNQPISLATANLVTLTATATDGDGDTASATVNLGGNLVFRDDAPAANPDTNAVVEGGIVNGNVLTDGADDVFGADGPAAGGGVVGVRAAGGDTTSAVTTGVNTVIQGLYGTLTVQANGSYVYDGDPNAVPPAGATDVFVYTIRDGDGDQSTTTLTITLTDSGLAAANEDATVNEAALPSGSNPGSTAETVTGTVADNVTGGAGALTYALVGSPAGTYGTITLNPNGSWSYTLASPVIGPNANNGPNTVNNAETFTYRVTDANGNTSTNTITIDIIDDVPTATVPIAVNVINQSGATNAAFLDTDNNVANNYGADGPGKVFFTSDAVTALLGQSLTSGGQPLSYAISADGLTLTATKPDASVVFTIQIQPAGFADQYKVTMSQPLDAVVDIDFNAAGYNFSGGNPAWNFFRDDGTANSQDILLTPIGPNGQTVNTNANSGGIGGGGGGGAIESGEGMRIDFVIDLLGSPASGGSGYQTPANRNHTFSDHYTVNGASAVFASTSGSTVRFAVKDDPDGPTGNDAVGDGTADTITSVAIRFGAATITVNSSGSPQNVTVGGQSYTVTFSGGEVTISGIVSNTQVAIFTANGYNSLEIYYVSGSSFRIGDFGASAISTTEPVPFTVPVSIVDGDGDVSASGVLSITAVPAAPPVTLDLDGDGLEFLPLSHGVAFDYNGDGVREPTAWVGPDDGLLVHDANGDGIVNDGSEIVFSINGSTDLEGLRLRFDTNGDGKLTADDAAFASFAVWQDANSNGVTDPGELRSLSDLGIVGIDLTAGGAPYTTASGSVLVSGETHFIRSDGSQGTVGDAAFATSAGRAVDEAQRAAAQSVANQAMASSLVAAGLVATIGAAAPAHAAMAGADSVPAAGTAQDDDVLLARPRGEIREAIDEGLAADHGADTSALSGRSGGSAGDAPMFEARIDAGDGRQFAALPQDDGSAASQAGGIANFIDMSAIPVVAGPDVGEAGFAAAMMVGPQLGAVLADALDAGSPHGDIGNLLSGLPHGGEAMAGQMAMAMPDSASFFDPAMTFMHQAADLNLASHDAVMATAHS